MESSLQGPDFWPFLPHSGAVSSIKLPWIQPIAASLPTFTQLPSCPRTSNRVQFGADLTTFAFVLGSTRMFTEAALMITLGFGATGVALMDAGAAATSDPMTGL